MGAATIAHDADAKNKTMNLFRGFVERALGVLIWRASVAEPAKRWVRNKTDPTMTACTAARAVAVLVSPRRTA